MLYVFSCSDKAVVLIYKAFTSSLSGHFVGTYTFSFNLQELLYVSSRRVKAFKMASSLVDELLSKVRYRDSVRLKQEVEIVMETFPHIFCQKWDV